MSFNFALFSLYVVFISFRFAFTPFHVPSMFLSCKGFRGVTGFYHPRKNNKIAQKGKHTYCDLRAFIFLSCCVCVLSRCIPFLLIAFKRRYAHRSFSLKMQYYTLKSSCRHFFSFPFMSHSFPFIVHSCPFMLHSFPGNFHQKAICSSHFFIQNTCLR